MHAHSTHPTTGLKPGDHLCFLYETDYQHRTVLMPFLRQGLEQDEKVLYVADDRTPQTILAYLQDTGMEVKPRLDSGQLAILTCDHTYLRGGVFDPEAMITLISAETEKALAEGYTALRGTSDMSWALRGLPGSERLVEYEARLNDVLPGSKCLVLCQYDRRRFDREDLWNLLRVHFASIVGPARYDECISKDTIANTSRCTSKLSCLHTAIDCLCEVQDAVDDEVIFVKCDDGDCGHRMSFGYSSLLCTCPVRKEIYHRYRI